MFCGAVINIIILLDYAGKISCQICGIHSNSKKIRLGIIAIQNRILVCFFIRSPSCKIAFPNSSFIFPACFSIVAAACSALLCTCCQSASEMRMLSLRFLIIVPPYEVGLGFRPVFLRPATSRMRCLPQTEVWDYPPQGSIL